MMVDKSMVSLDGSQCNMVGTSYTAFRYQTVGLLGVPLLTDCLVLTPFL